MNQSVAKLKDIHECFKDAANRLPSYKNMLPFFEMLYTIQEAGISGAQPRGMEEKLSSLPVQNGSRTPLIGRENFSTDPDSAVKILRTICENASLQGPKIEHAAAVLTTCIDKNEPAIQNGFKSLLLEDRASLQVLKKELDIDEDVLIFFLYHSIWPSLARQVQADETQKRLNPDWKYPVCPICGGSAHIAYLSETGKRHLVCGFCRHEWPVKRILCPYCETENPESISYIFSEDEKEYRIYTCTECHRYIKTVDTREFSRSFYAPLESLVTLHLDIHAESLGFQGSENNHLFGG